MLVSTQCVVRDREVERIPLSTIHRVAFGIPCRQDTLAQITMYAQEQLSFTHSSSKVLSPIRYPIQKMLAAKKVSCDTNRISVLSQLKASLAEKNSSTQCERIARIQLSAEVAATIGEAFILQFNFYVHSIRCARMEDGLILHTY